MAAPPPCQSFEGNWTEWINSLLVGLTFEPTDRELVGHYLNNKNRYGFVPTYGLINEINLKDYSEPSQLPNLPSRIDRGKKYFFTLWPMKNKRIDRKFGGGYWKITQNFSYVKGQEGESIGKKTPLAYYDCSNSKGQKTQWLMQQYTLLHGDPNLALCVVYLYKPERSNKKENGDDEDSQSSMPRTEVESSNKIAPASCWMPVSNPVQTPVTHPLQSSPSRAIPFPQFHSNLNPATFVVNTPSTTNSFPTNTESSEMAGFSHQTFVTGLGSESVSAPSHNPTSDQQTMPSNGNAVWGLEAHRLYPIHSPNHGNFNQESFYIPGHPDYLFYNFDNIDVGPASPNAFGADLFNQ